MFSILKATDAKGCLLFPAFPAPDLPDSKTILFCEHPKTPLFAPKSAGFAGLGGLFPNNVRKNNKSYPIYRRVVFQPLQIRQIRRHLP